MTEWVDVEEEVEVEEKPAASLKPAASVGAAASKSKKKAAAVGQLGKKKQGNLMGQFRIPLAHPRISSE